MNTEWNFTNAYLFAALMSGIVVLATYFFFLKKRKT